MTTTNKKLMSVYLFVFNIVYLLSVLVSGSWDRVILDPWCFENGLVVVIIIVR